MAAPRPFSTGSGSTSGSTGLTSSDGGFSISQVIPYLKTIGTGAGALANAINLFGKDVPAAQRGFAGANLASTGAEVLGGTAADLAGKAAGPLAAAAAGYQISKILGSDDLSKKQKVGHTGRTVSDAIMSLTIPYYGLAKAVNAVGGVLQGSGSPQVQGLGRSIDYLTEPSGAKAFWDVVQGDRSPKAAFKAAGGLEGLTLDLMGPLGVALRGAGINLPGLHHEPTTGTQFRDQLARVGEQAGVKLTDVPYNIDPKVWEAASPEARAGAGGLGFLLASYAPKAKENPTAYGNQAAVMLMNSYGVDTGTFALQTLTDLGFTNPTDAFLQVVTNIPLSADDQQRVWSDLNALFGAKPGAIPTLPPPTKKA